MKRILHVSLYAYNDGWGYQENLLPKYQALKGNDVTLITVNEMYKGTRIVSCGEEEFDSVDGFKVIRIKQREIINRKITKVFNYAPIYKIINNIKPDLIFFHSLNSFSIFDVIKYKKKDMSCVIVQDNHLDNNIGFKPEKSKKHYFLVLIYRWLYRRSRKYIDKVYGVTPCRVEYAHRIFGVEENKLDLLIMGADDENICYDKREDIRLHIREKLDISKDDFLIITGGKIDMRKTETIYLINAVKSFENVKLIIYGSVDKDYEKEFYKSLNENCVFVGWVDTKQIYKYFFASDLGFYPGFHSVLWEQACACNLPCVFRNTEGMNHLWDEGNAIPIEHCDTESIRKMIERLNKTDEYDSLLSNANKEEMNKFKYSFIAEKSLETIK